MPLNDSTEASAVSTTSNNSNDIFNPPLPGSLELWQKCDLGLPETWPSQLQAYTFTISCLTYPAALLYGDKFVLLHNKAWEDVGGNEQQGRGQRGRLSADVWEAFQAGLRGEPARQISSHDILKGGPDLVSDEYTVCLSPLRDTTGKEVVLLLVQLVPASAIISPSKPSLPSPQPHSGDEILGVAATRDKGTPLDKHPFFHKFAEMLPCGLAILDRDAQAVYVNQVFYTMTTHRGTNQDFYGWPESIHPEDKERVLSAYHDAFANQEQLRTEFRSQGPESNPWRLLLMTPLGDANLEYISLSRSGGFICCIVDISSEKSAELNEREAARDAEERKEVLTSFIDMVSHEIRNPLSAVLHCAEDINDAVHQQPVDTGAIEDAIETINVCIAHQKNIVDDVLSFSKLDASMLTLVPSACRPAHDIAESLKMFQPELRKSGIAFSINVDQSYKDCEIEWAMADLARIGQVLINLMSNAIKFTAHSENSKRIDVNLGSSRDRPTNHGFNGVSFNLDEQDFHMDATHGKEWGTGEALYVTVAVQDTGIGISELDQQKLFERFRQATPKTAETYGGSGLGLNISRKLCQLHGGEIGVSAKEGVGSTFAFFFKIRKIDSPTDQQRAGHSRNPTDSIPRTRSSNLQTDARRRTESRPASVRSVGHTALPDYKNLASATDEAASPELTTTKATGSTNDVHGPKSPSGRTSPEAPHRIHVLLVEDNIVNQRILSKRLTSKGFTVTTTSNGREAVNAVISAPKLSSANPAAFDIILMDNEMPILDGNEATKEIRELQRRNEVEHVPILGVTANVRGAQQDEMKQCGMDDVISKPYRIDDLIERVLQIIDAQKK